MAAYDSREGPICLRPVSFSAGTTQNWRGALVAALIAPVYDIAACRRALLFNEILILVLVLVTET